MHSQNNEEQIVLEYFGDFKGTLLDIGANDGITYSNSYGLIQNGWKGVLLEPSNKAFEKLLNTYVGNPDAINNPNVLLFHLGIAIRDGEFDFLESSAFDHKGDEVGLLSTLLPSETQRWGDKVSFENIKATFCSWKTFRNNYVTGNWGKFQFITIDAEGMDWAILSQIDLNDVDCQCLCIEHNSQQWAIDKYNGYMLPFGFEQIGFNAENIIYARPKNG